MTDFGLRMNRAPALFRKTVTLVASGGPVETNSFLADFLGAGSLDGYTPEVGGGAITLDAGSSGALADATFTGTGALNMSRSAGNADIYAFCSMDSPPGLVYSFEWKFTPTLADFNTSGFGNGYFDFHLENSADAPYDRPLIQTLLYCQPETGFGPLAWTFNNFVVSTAATPYAYDGSADVTAAVTLNVEHTVRVNVTAGGCALLLDGVEILSTVETPDILPDRFRFVAYAGDTNVAGTLNRARVFTTA